MRARAVVPLATSLLLCCAGAAKPASDAVAEEPLPRVFRGVTWTTTADELKALLPSAKLFDPTDWSCEDGSRCVTWGATASGWPAFGHAQVELSGRAGERAGLVTVRAVDPRDGCRDGSEAPRPKDCVDEPGPAMDAAFARMRKALEAQLGPGRRERLDPSLESGPSAGTPAQRAANERSVRWKRRGYDVTLHVFAGEDGWYLEVQASREWKG
jgi:hypothetical protein